MSLRSSGVAFLAAGCLAAAVPLPAQPSEQAQQAGATAAPRRPKIGLALGGGGARGFAHIGVLRALESLHIQIDYIAGTSMGSVVGSLYATGYSTDQIEAIVEKIPWATVFIDEPERQKLSFRNKEDDFLHLLPLQFGIKKGGLALPPGLVAGNKLSFVLESVLLPSESAPDFAHLRIPFKAVATDVQTGVPVVLSKGSLAHSVRASMAVPAVFTPVEIDGKLLVDGGESENLPVQTVRAMGADIVIAIDVGASGEASKAPENVAQMIGAIIDIPLKQNTDASRKLADLVIQPDLRGYTSADFLKYAELIPKGQEAAMRASAELTRWSEPAAAFDAWRAAKEASFPPAPVIDAVEVAPVPGFDQDRLTRLVKSQPGRPLDFKVLAKDMHRIYAIGAFSIVSYDVVEEGGRRILRITAIPKTWGPTFVRPGLGLESDGKSNTAFDVDLLVDATEMNRLGGRWKTLLDVGSNLGISSVFYQPVEATGTFSLAPNVQWSQHTQSIYAAEEQVARYLVRRFNGGLDLVADFGTWGELRAGYQGGTGNATRQVGIGLLPDIHADFGAIGARFDVDQLDNVNVPRVGYLSRVRFEAQRPGLGASASYDKLEGEALGVQTLGRWSGLLKVAGGDGLGTTLPYYQTFPLGGLFRLSGRPQDQLRGQTYLLGAALLYYRLNRTSGLIIKDLYLGVSAEAGNTWDLRKNVSLSDLRTSGSVFVAVNSLIGPVYIAWGHASGGSNALYFALNRSF